MAVPRTPVQTDRLDTAEASAVYRATRDNNRQVIKAAKCQMSYFIFYQGELHKSEKRATSTGGKADKFLFNCLTLFVPIIKKKTSGGCVTSSSSDFGSSYRPFEQLVLPA